MWVLVGWPMWSVDPRELHIPDGFLSLGVLVLCWVVSVGVLALAVRKVWVKLGERQVPLLGVMAAFVFAAQMLNFPVAGGTSGHLIGGALAAILLGPWEAMLLMSVVLGVQAVIFQDGGLLALGANLLNMAVVAPWVGYGVWRVVSGLVGGKRAALVVGGGLAGWFSVEVAALLCAVELGLSGYTEWSVVLPAMGGVHALIGIGEGVITAAVLLFVARVVPELGALLFAEKGGVR